MTFEFRPATAVHPASYILTSALLEFIFTEAGSHPLTGETVFTRTFTEFPDASIEHHGTDTK